MTVKTTSTRARAAILGALACSALLPGCASTGKGALPQWPLPPDPPRIKFVRTIASEDDLARGFFGTVKGAVLGASDVAIRQATGMAFSVDEKVLYVASGGVGSVLAVDFARGSIKRVAESGSHRVVSPFTVAVDAEDNFYVTDMAANAVLVFARDGKFLREFEKEKLERPTGLAIDRRRQVAYVVSGVTQPSQHHRVEVFSLQGKHLRTIGTRGGGPGEFNFPNHVAVSKDGAVFVVDMLNFRIQVFDPEGQVQGMFGKIGAGQPGTFDKAKGIAFDSFGNIYVADSHQAYVQMFDAKFHPLMAFGGRAALPGFMGLPTAIAIDSRNNIYVAEFHRGGIGQYQLIDASSPGGATPGAGKAPGKP